MSFAEPPQIQNIEPTTVQEVVVADYRAPPSPDLMGYSVVRIDEAALRASDRLDAALTATPGVSLFRRNSSQGANPTTQGVSVRAIAGTGAGRALVTLDGIPQNDPFGGWVIWSALPVDALARVDIVRGAGSAREGPAALTGLIALSRSDDHVDAASLTDHGDRKLFGQAGFAALNGRITADVGHEDSDGWVPVQQGAGAADQKLTLESASTALRYDGYAGDVWVAARVAAFNERRGSGLLGAQSRTHGGQVSLSLQKTPRQGLGWRVQGWLSDSNLYNTSVATAAGRATTTPANRQYDTPATGYGLSAEVQQITGEVTLRAGVDVRGASGESREQFRYLSGAFTRNRVAGGDAQTVGLFSEAAFHLRGFAINTGLRGDYWKNSDAHRRETNAQTGAVTLNSAAPDRDGVAPTARLSVSHDVWGDLKGRALVYQGFRPPTLNELHRPFRVGNDVTEANPTLKPERLSGAELGLSGRTLGIDWSGTVFANRLADAVANVTVANGPLTDSVAGFIPAGGVLRQRRNVDAVNATGIEAQARYPLLDNLDLTASVALTRARVDGGGGAVRLTGLRPAGTPDAAAVVGVAWRATSRLTLSSNLRQEGRRFDDDQNLRPLRAGATGDLRASWSLASGAEVYLAADNIGQRVQTARDATGLYSYGPPTTVRLGFSWRR